MSGLKFVDAGDFIDSSSKTPEWVLEPLVTVGGAIMLYGRQKVGKSTLTAQLAHSLSTGEPWLGFPVRRKGNVLILELDMSPAEIGHVLVRAERAGYSMRNGVYVPEFERDEFRVLFDIFDKEDKARLTEWCRKLEPIAVIVDTINDAYQADTRGDVNHLVRRVLTEFRDAIGRAVLIYINHTRKKALNVKGAEVEDTDNYLGGGATAAWASCILELKKKTLKKGKDAEKTVVGHALVIHDARSAGDSEQRILTLKKDELGFFSHPLDVLQMLEQWPAFLSLEEQAKCVLSSKADVFRSVASAGGFEVATVRQAFYRQRRKGVEYAWLAGLEDDGEREEEGCDDDVTTPTLMLKGVTLPMSHAVNLRDVKS